MTHVLADFLCSATCPACGHHAAAAFFDGGQQPLATIVWPGSSGEAQAMPRLPLDFMRCLDCGHVYNAAFNYVDVPYSDKFDKPNMMFNHGAIWGEHLRRVCELILAHVPAQPVIVEIGCGKGDLLRALAELRPAGRYIGFDPGAGVISGNARVEARQELFDPKVHLAECRPDMIVARHVFEHLISPLAFIQETAFSAAWLGQNDLKLFAEVPCIDRVFSTGRTVDFFYEHNSHFTTHSFTNMLEKCSSQIELIERGYGEEVIYGVARLGAKSDTSATASRKPRAEQLAEQANSFRDGAKQAQQNIARQLAELHASGKKTAIWGGIGKAAAFINFFGADAGRFPLVVDSDKDKVGTFVPGAGQLIRYRDYLLAHPVEVILIPSQWRTKDILGEVARCGIQVETVLIEHLGRLINYHTEPHPYA